MDVGLRGSGHNKQNNDPPPGSTGTKPSEFKSCREKVRRWLLFTRTPAQLQGPHVLSRLTGPAWDACGELGPEDVATADGVNMILDTLAEAFQGEHDVDGSHTAFALQVKEALIEQEDIDLETALAASELESDTDLEETDGANIKPRQLRGEQRMRCEQEYGVCSNDISYQPNVDCEWGEWNSWTPCNVMIRDGEEAKTSFFVHFGRDHSMSDYMGKGVIDTGCSRFLIGQNTLEKWEQMLTRRWGLSTQRIQLAKAMTFRFGNDETLETRTLAVLPGGIAGINGVSRMHVVPGGAPLLLSKEFLRDLGCHIDLGRGHLFFEKLGVRAVVTSEQSPHLLFALVEFWTAGTQDPG